MSEYIDPAEMIATLILQIDAGDVDGKVGDDQESQHLAAKVRRLNPRWKPGMIARTRVQPPPVVRIAPMAQTAAAPRERRSRPTQKASSSGPDDSESDPPPANLQGRERVAVAGTGGAR